MVNASGDVLTRGDVARIFKVHPGTVSKWLEAGQIAAIRTPGGQARYLRSDIEAFLQSAVRES